VGASLRQARSQGQDGLGPIEGLDLALLVDTEHHRLVGRVHVKPDDIDDLLRELRIVGELERAR
jgi:hypothetical protein